MAHIPGKEWHLQTQLVPSREEMARVLDEARGTNPRDFVFFTLVSHSGLRVCEAAHVKASDLVNGNVMVTRRKKRVLQKTPMKVSKALWNLLAEWGQSFDDWLFPGAAKPCVIHRRNGTNETACEGGHLHIRTLQMAWRMTISRAGLYMKGRGIHQTRHYFATELYKSTRDLRATQEALAHSSSMMTEKYAHVVDLQEKVNMVEPLFAA